MFRHYHPRPLEIIDTTLREGQQSPLLHDHHKYFLTTEDKRDLLAALIRYGVKFVELFAPVVSPREAEDFAALRQVRDDLAPQYGYTFLLAHVRCHPRDVTAAVEAGFDGLNLYFGTSPQSRAFNHRKDTETIIRQSRALLEDLRRDQPHLVLRFSGEDAFRTPLEDLFRVYDAVVPLVDRLGVPDTVGTATPAQVDERIRALRARYPDTPLEVHFHDDRGLALINTLTAVRAGAQYVDTTLLGIGERSGITSMTALLFNLFVDGDYDRVDGYRLRASYPINVLAADKLRCLVPAKEPVSLTNRTHTAGVHQGAVLRHPSTYEAHPLELFGVDEREILLGPLSGWNVVHYFLREIHGFEVDEATAREITARFKALAHRISEDEPPARWLLRLAQEEFHLTPAPPPPPQAPHLLPPPDLGPRVQERVR